MKTISEAGQEMWHEENSELDHCEYEGIFRNGVEFAQRWIPVQEELPEIDESVLMRNSFGCYGVGRWNGAGWIFSSIEGIADLSNWVSRDCTHWRPI